MPPNALNLQECKGDWLPVVAMDPKSVCCAESLMVCALRSVGVTLHPAFPVRSYTIEVEGQPVTFWRWYVSAASRDGKYQTPQLIAWWKDAAWLKANPQHEFAIVCAALKNMGVQAGEIRQVIPRIVVQKGSLEAHIPANASEDRKAFLLGKLDGKIPFSAKFEEEAAA